MKKTEKKEKTDKTEKDASLKIKKQENVESDDGSKPTLKRGKSSQEITVADLVEADGFNPSALPFSFGWEKYLKSFYQLTVMRRRPLSC